MIIPFEKQDIAIDILVPICPMREAWLAWRITGAGGCSQPSFYVVCNSVMDLFGSEWPSL
jgi:hypothetical protein